MLRTIISISAALLLCCEAILLAATVQTIARPGNGLAQGANFSPSATQEPTPTPTPTPTPPPPPPPPPRSGLKSRRIGHAFYEGPPPCDRTEQEQLDISGNYEGTLKYPDAGLSGNATLVIRGKELTVSKDDKKLSGQIVATRTCDYSAVALRLDEASSILAGTSSGLPITISLRAKKDGKRLWLISVPGEPNLFEFTPRGRSLWRLLKIWKWVP